jgi:hypothetical protein
MRDFGMSEILPLCRCGILMNTAQRRIFLLCFPLLQVFHWFPVRLALPSPYPLLSGSPIRDGQRAVTTESLWCAVC